MSPENFVQGMQRLLNAVKKLSLAHDLETIMQIVRQEARELTGADGATFVLRDNDCCYYAEENAIAPLWKGKRFPMTKCISGWVMLNKKSVIIEDIYADPRIPADAYRPTFVKSLAMVPIRTESPIGAIGNYWSAHYKPSPEELTLLQGLADSTSIAMENVHVYETLENRVKSRTAQLETVNKELEAFSYSVSHDLRAPLRAIDGFSRILLESYADKMDSEAKQYLDRILNATSRMTTLIEDLLKLSRISRSDMNIQTINLTDIAQNIITNLVSIEPHRTVTVTIAPNLYAKGDPGLITAVMENLLNNAWKFTSKKAKSEISVGSVPNASDKENTTFFVRDNGAGFDMNHVDRLFSPFQRLHTTEDFPGTGVGLATVARIIHRHEGSIRAESEKEKGTCFYFTLGS